MERGLGRRRIVACALLLALVVAGLTAGAAAASGPRFTPRVHRDAADARKDPDLRAVAFGQVGTQLSLTVRTRRAWTSGSLCVTLLGDRPVGQMCVAAHGRRRPTVRYRPAGTGGSLRTVRGAEVERSGRTLRALVYPRALGLRPGSLRWSVQSTGSCGRRCVDRLPDAGTLSVRVGVYGAPRCFGAAAMAGESGCENPALRRLVTPAPSDAELMPDFRCAARHIRRYAPVVPCLFGARYLAGTPRLALIGDSHAMSFRATAEVAAQALRLKAVSLTQAGCGFATEVGPGWPPVDDNCRRYVSRVLRWLGDHPSTHTVLVTASATHGYTEDGLRAMWDRIPESVRDIYVVADVPRVSYKTAGCVKSVRRRHAVSAGACALARDEALPPDPAAPAADGAGPRVHLIDLTRYFCDSTHCFPVIGGAYVYRDTNHMNTVFGATLGPYLLEGMRSAG